MRLEQKYRHPEQHKKLSMAGGVTSGWEQVMSQTELARHWLLQITSCITAVLEQIFVTLTLYAELAAQQQTNVAYKQVMENAVISLQIHTQATYTHKPHTHTSHTGAASIAVNPTKVM
jgi:hypothetical protein